MTHIQKLKTINHLLLPAVSFEMNTLYQDIKQNVQLVCNLLWGVWCTKKPSSFIHCIIQLQNYKASVTTVQISEHKTLNRIYKRPPCLNQMNPIWKQKAKRWERAGWNQKNIVISNREREREWKCALTHSDSITSVLSIHKTNT